MLSIRSSCASGSTASPGNRESTASQRDPGLEPGQGRPEAEVDALPEGEVTVG